MQRITLITEFSNIKANPIEQVVHFPITKGNQIRLVATRIVDNKKQAGIGEFSVITENKEYLIKAEGTASKT